MDFITVVESRRSVRRYKPDDIPQETLERILNAGRLAPSWGNVQPWRFIVVRDADKKKKLSEACKGQKQVEKAPVVIVCCGDITAWNEQKERLSELADIGALRVTKEFIEKSIMTEKTFNPRLMGKEHLIRRTHEQVYLAIENIQLAAVNEGLGSCIVAGGLDEEMVKEILHVPESVVVTALLPIGYPLGEAPRSKRIPLENIVYNEEWGKKV